MQSVICTLFENHYHHGVATLVNSLYEQGYRGDIYAGYKGALPDWSATAIENPALGWIGSRSLRVTADLQVHFLLLDTSYHLTNYKPDFMLRLWDGPANGAKAMFYFDPDIVVTTPWQLFEEWVEFGVALCEDVNSPLAKYHPIRESWRKYFGNQNIPLHFKEAIYANGGFVGVSSHNHSFLTMWQRIQEAMAPAIGGLAKSSFTEVAPLPFAPFGKTDQDALNACVEAWDGNASFVGKEGMAFLPGSPLMTHALGSPKPWHRKPLRLALVGQPPRPADRDYWQAANSLICSQPSTLVKQRRLATQLAALIGRFYSRR
jgi:hypothetical protein